jgi:hypothetical protein
LLNNFELKELIPIHRVAMDIKILSRIITIDLTGRRNLKQARKIKGMVSKIVFIVYKIMDKIPLRLCGKNESINVYLFLKFIIYFFMVLLSNPVCFATCS